MQPTRYRRPRKVTHGWEHDTTLILKKNSASFTSHPRSPLPGLPAAISGRTAPSAGSRRRGAPADTGDLPPPAAASSREGRGTPARLWQERNGRDLSARPGRAAPPYPLTPDRRPPAGSVGRARPHPGRAGPDRGVAPRPRGSGGEQSGAGATARWGGPLTAGASPRLAPCPHSRQLSPSWRPGRWRGAAPTCCCRTYTGLRDGQRDTGQERGGGTGAGPGRRGKAGGRRGGRGAARRAAAGDASAAGERGRRPQPPAPPRPCSGAPRRPAPGQPPPRPRGHPGT